MKKGQIVAVEIGFGNIVLRRFHSDIDGTKFSAFLYFDMKSSNTVVFEWKDIIPLSDIQDIIQKG